MRANRPPASYFRVSRTCRDHPYRTAERCFSQVLRVNVCDTTLTLMRPSGERTASTSGGIATWDAYAMIILTKFRAGAMETIASSCSKAQTAQLSLPWSMISYHVRA